MRARSPSRATTSPSASPASRTWSARGKDGEVRVLANRCTHRGNRLCNADKGNSSSFRCPYHGWTFSNDGSLSGVPMRDGYAERFGEIRASLGLVRAPRQESYGGFVFASLAPEGITLAEHLGNARHAIDRLVALSPTGSVQLTAGWMKHRMYCNWKMVMENNVDGYHALFTHQSVYDAVRPAKVSHVPSKTETMVRDMGNGHSEIDYATEYRRLDEEFVWYGRLKREKVPGYIAALEEARGVDGAHDTLVIGPPHTLIFPNLFIAEMNVMTVEPLSVRRDDRLHDPGAHPWPAGDEQPHAAQQRGRDGAGRLPDRRRRRDRRAQPARPRRARAGVGDAQPRP